MNGIPNDRTLTLTIVPKSGKKVTVADLAHVLNALNETYKCFDKNGELKIKFIGHEKEMEEIRAEQFKSPSYMAQYED